SLALVFSSSQLFPSPALRPYTTLFRPPGGERRLVLRTGTDPPRCHADARALHRVAAGSRAAGGARLVRDGDGDVAIPSAPAPSRSEEHTSELQSREKHVCRLLLEKKKN